jgi:peptidoglycan/LPS O-acetylase OafA/YrhL
MSNSCLLLSDVLKRGGNNFDVLRLIAASAVIIGHAYAISPQPPLQDAVLSLLHFDYSGSLAVKFFFFLSGLLVSDSIIRRPTVFQFLTRRAFRIFPGLIVCLMISVFLVGPVFTKLPINDYFAQTETWTYLIRNTLLNDLQWKLPGVFSESKYGLNGSLWTLPYESICYLYIAIFCGIGLFPFRFAANVVFTAIVLTAFLAPQYLPRFAQNPEAVLLPAFFSLGALFAINKQLIKIDLQRVILLWIFVVLVNEPSAHRFLFYIAFFYTTIFLASLGFVIKHLKLPFDASYGVYVYGFMIQQCVVSVYPNIGVHGNQFISLIIAISIGICSWFYIEKPAIAFGAKLTSSDGIDFQLFKKLHTVMGSILDAKSGGYFQKISANSKSVVIGISLILLLALISLYGLNKNNLSVQKNITQDSSRVALTVVNWGPQSASVGTNPNIQPDGSMGIWIMVSDTQDFGEAQVTFGGDPMQTVVQSKLITAAIPLRQLDQVSSKEVLIKQISTGRIYEVGRFIVESQK